MGVDDRDRARACAKAAAAEGYVKAITDRIVESTTNDCICQAQALALY